MSKKTSISTENYSRVGSRLKSVIAHQEHQEKSENPITSIQARLTPKAVKPLPAPLPMQREPISSELRCRCTRSERKRWHEFAYLLTGEPNRFSHIFRALLLLLGNSKQTLLNDLRPMFQSLENPPKNDSLAITLYEQRLAELLWEALRRAEKPQYER